MSDSEATQITVSLVVPAFNEEGNIMHFVSAVETALPAELSYEILFIDDGSTDNTWPAIEATSENKLSVSGLKLSRNFGKEAAMRLGLEQARGKAVIVLDADLQHPPEILPEMIAKWQEGRADVVEAVKKDRGREGAAYRICSLLFYQTFSKLTGLDLRGSSDFKLLDRKVVDSLLQCDERAIFFRGMTQWVGFTHLQIPFEVAERVDGRSGWTAPGLAKFFLDSVVSFTSIPLLAVSFCGFLFLLVALLLGFQTFLMYLSGKAVEGFTTVILVQLFTGSCILVSLGAVGLYISVMFKELKRRPLYFVEKTTGTSSDRKA